MLSSESDSDNDLEIQSAMEASLQHQKYVYVHKTWQPLYCTCSYKSVYACSDDLEMSREDVAELKQHFELYPISTDPEGYNRFSVCRSHLWKDSIRALSRLSFNSKKAVRVTILGDARVDEGGPGREYFYLTLQCITEDNSISKGPVKGDLSSTIHRH